MNVRSLELICCCRHSVYWLFFWFACPMFDSPLKMNLPGVPPSHQQKVTVAYSAQKLYESVLGYFQGFHRRPGQIEKKPTAGSKKWSGPSKTVTEDDHVVRTAEINKNLALARMDRNEWDLAIPALARALKSSSRLVSADDVVRLNDMLQKARAKAQNGSQEASPSTGEITNSIGMRLVTIRPGAFVMGSTPAETRRIQAEWNVPETMLQAESPAHNVQNIQTLLNGQI